LKLELDYKLSDALNNPKAAGVRDTNEFMYFDGPELIGYIGICGFGGGSMPLEITGMVHPEYRRQGIFSKLHEQAANECRRRNAGSVLLLCDQESFAGRQFQEKIGAEYKYSEFEKYIPDGHDEMAGELPRKIELRKASNRDAVEVARQNAIYFEDRAEQEGKDVPDEILLMPEEEENRGMTIYLAEEEGTIIGKVHLQISNGTGAIYGLGVLPEYRREGLGRAILLKAIETLKAADVKQIMLQVAADNAKALHLYKSCGFEVTSVMGYYDFK
jgi:mycothiol synthase